MKMFLWRLYLLDIVHALKTSHASKMLDIVGICSFFIYVFWKRPNNGQVIQSLF